MHDIFNYVNALLALLCLLLYLQSSLALPVRKTLSSLAADSLPFDPALTATAPFRLIAADLFGWYVLVSIAGILKLQRSRMKSCCLDLVFAAFNETLCIYLLLAGAIAVGVALKLVL